MKKEKEIYLTEEGLEEIKKELEVLKLEKRPEIITALKEARAQGDLSENADYDAAREEQAKTESKIKELEYMLEHATIIKLYYRISISTSSKYPFILFIIFIIFFIITIFIYNFTIN